MVDESASEVTAPKKGRMTIDQLRRAELVDAAVEVITEHGFDHTTIRDIAERANASNGSVHYYFKTKDELLRAAFLETEARFRARTRNELSELRGLEKLKRLGESCFALDSDSLAQWNIEIDLWQQAARNEEIRSVFEETNSAWVTFISAAIAEGIGDGDLKADLNVHDTALELAALIDGLGLYCRVTNHTTAADAQATLRRRIESLRS